MCHPADDVESRGSAGGWFSRGLNGFSFVCGCFCRVQFCFSMSSFALFVRMVASSSLNPAPKSDICRVSQSGNSDGDCARSTRAPSVLF